MGLDKRTKELVAVGAAIGANCMPCIQWHSKKCFELGVTKPELQEAMELAKAIARNVGDTRR